MSKLSQLQDLQKLNLPGARFVAITWQDFIASENTIERSLRDLKFPVAVRSTYSEEDGDEKSYAGAFHTELNVERKNLRTAIEKVFNSYPRTLNGDYSNQSVIVQEMIQSDYSGVLFAFRNGIWKCEFVRGLGENMVSAVVNPERFILPRFDSSDKFFYPLFKFWKPFSKEEHQKLIPSFIQLSIAAQKLSTHYKHAGTGIDIEFAIKENKLYLLQSRPITTPNECEEVLTSANHKEILPPIPSRAMISLIESCSKNLFQYYRNLDPSLAPYNFIRTSEGMPWLNLSALLDTMIHWGLPTNLVCKSVGARDYYRVSLRPHRALIKLPVFLKVLWQQITIPSRVLKWVKISREKISGNIDVRKKRWEQNPGEALLKHRKDFEELYTGLVGNMQALTGSMSGPLKMADKLGVLASVTSQISKKSSSTDYLSSFNLLQQGGLTREEFIVRFGHRGFYESDIGQMRFSEYTNEQWNKLVEQKQKQEKGKEIGKGKENGGFSIAGIIFKPLIILIQRREWIRDESMKLFQLLRNEITTEAKRKYGSDFIFSDYSYQELEELFENKTTPADLKSLKLPTPSGWDMDTFLVNRLDKRTDISHYLLAEEGANSSGVGIYPGIVKGQVWRVSSADFTQLEKPTFENTILIADTLDPGWVPYFTQVDAVGSYVGGLLSHASIILRESKIPSVTQLPSDQTFQTGDWVILDGKKGTVVLADK